MLNQFKAAIMAISRSEVKGESPNVRGAVLSQEEYWERRGDRFDGRGKAIYGSSINWNDSGEGTRVNWEELKMAVVRRQPFRSPGLVLSAIHLVA